MKAFLHDARFALRMLRRSLLFSGAAVLALGVGIAGNTAIFSLIDALLLRPTPGVEAPAELAVFERWQAGQLLGNMGYPDFRDYRDRLKSFSGVAAEADAPPPVSRAAPPASTWPPPLVSGKLLHGSTRREAGCRPPARGCG